MSLFLLGGRMAASAECRHWSGGQSVGQVAQFCLVLPSFARPSRRHQRARPARPAYRAQSRNRLGCFGHQVRLPVAGAERGLDIERGRFRVCRQHLCDNGGDSADIEGAVGKQNGVTVLAGKRHDPRIASGAPIAEYVRRGWRLLSDFEAPAFIARVALMGRPFRDSISVTK